MSDLPEPEPGREPGLDPDDEPGAAAVLLAAVVVYGVMAGAALLWLWLRERLDQLPAQAVGEHGPWLASAVGLAVGLVGAWTIADAMRRSPRVEQVSRLVARLFTRTGEAAGITFVLVSAVCEELFFRLAVQDALGIVGAVACYVVVNSSVGGVRWLLFTMCHALALGLIVELGFGLLGSTTAHAIFNYLGLRRLQET